jgi:hypothetical protein
MTASVEELVRRIDELESRAVLRDDTCLNDAEERLNFVVGWGTGVPGGTTQSLSKPSR